MSQVITAGIMIGMALAGFLDGIVFHQLLQWHHMFSGEEIPGDTVRCQVNMFGDGAFHASMWVLLLGGITYLWTSIQKIRINLPFKMMFSLLITGIGLFNILEGIIDHHFLKIHHVKPGPYQTEWDLGFLIINLVVLIFGYILLRNNYKKVILK